MNMHFSVFAVAVLSCLMAAQGLFAADHAPSRCGHSHSPTRSDLSLLSASRDATGQPSLSLASRPLGPGVFRPVSEGSDWQESSEALFDGKSLAGWEGDPKAFRVEDGAIVGGTLDARVPRNAFLSTKREYADFELRLQFKLLGKGANGGVQLRSRRIPNHHEMIGYQADLGNGWWGCLYDESRRRKILAGPKPEERNELVKQNEWNEYRIRCQGSRIQLWINGTQTVDYTEPDPDIEQKGHIAVQIHGGPPSEAWYKDLRIMELP
ncbi:MAG: 3-keto-disaccharide hydrolase [Planctomycetota bacterium]